MASAYYCGRFPYMPGALSLPAARGRAVNNFGVSVSRQSLPDDPVGTFVLTLTNLVVGSAIQIEDQAGTTTLHNSTTSTTLKSISLQAYAPGSPLNNLRIKVRKGSAPTYQPWETLATAVIGSNSIYVSQIPDE